MFEVDGILRIFPSIDRTSVFTHRSRGHSIPVLIRHQYQMSLRCQVLLPDFHQNFDKDFYFIGTCSIPVKRFNVGTLESGTLAKVLVLTFMFVWKMLEAKYSRILIKSSHPYFAKARTLSGQGLYQDQPFYDLESIKYGL